MLIGIVKKNAIMMIDVALVLQREGRKTEEAIHQACLRRFRPIMMTTLAVLMGTLPIALGTGASAELRQPLGIAVVGGLIVSQVLTLFITPVLFVYMDRLSEALGRLPQLLRRGAGGGERTCNRPRRRCPAAWCISVTTVGPRSRSHAGRSDQAKPVFVA